MFALRTQFSIKMMEFIEKNSCTLVHNSQFLCATIFPYFLMLILYFFKINKVNESLK